MAYRIYVTDSLFYYSQNKRLTSRYYDLIKQHGKVDNRSGDEIALDVMAKAGLKFKED